MLDRIKKLSQRIKSRGGRSQGLITSPRKVNLNRRIYRFIDFNRNSFSLGTILRIDYDPNRNCKIALLVFSECYLSYVLFAETNKIGSKLMNNSIRNSIGDSSKICNINQGSLIYNLSLLPKMPGQYVRSAGNSAILVKADKKVSLLKLKSGEYRYFFSDTLAVVGKVNSGDYFLNKWRLAGKSIRMGIRPRTRAYAKNPVDHPMGGRTKGGTAKLTPKGKICLNSETRKRKSKFVIIKKREKKKI